MAWPRSVCGPVSRRLDRYLFLLWLAKANLNFHFYWPEKWNGIAVVGRKRNRRTIAIVSVPLQCTFEVSNSFLLSFNSIFPMMNAFSFPSIIVVTQSTIACRFLSAMQCYCNSRESTLLREGIRVGRKGGLHLRRSQFFSDFLPPPPCPCWATNLYLRFYATSLMSSAFP